jgi:hypothetical protein
MRRVRIKQVSFGLQSIAKGSEAVPDHVNRSKLIQIVRRVGLQLTAIGTAIISASCAVTNSTAFGRQLIANSSEAVQRELDHHDSWPEPVKPARF